MKVKVNFSDLNAVLATMRTVEVQIREMFTEKYGNEIYESVERMHKQLVGTFESSL